MVTSRARSSLALCRRGRHSAHWLCAARGVPPQARLRATVSLEAPARIGGAGATPLRRPAASCHAAPLRLPSRGRRRPGQLGRAARTVDAPAHERRAARTEDHPIEYLDFEGVIPSGEYGGGDVIVWDQGTWEPEGLDRSGSRHRSWRAEVRPPRRAPARAVRARATAATGTTRPEDMAAHPQAGRAPRSRLGHRRPTETAS